MSKTNGKELEAGGKELVHKGTLHSLASGRISQQEHYRPGDKGETDSKYWKIQMAVMNTLSTKDVQDEGK